MLNRRRWLKVGLLGGAALGAAGLVAQWQGRPGWQGSNSPRALDHPPPSSTASPWSAPAAGFFSAIAPVLLAGASANAQDTQRVVEGVRVAIAALSPAAQRDMGELLTLLNITPARGVLTGVWGPWSGASHADIEAFLERWRGSRLALLQACYHALHDLVLAAWYAEPAAWAAIGYPGPPALHGNPSA